MLCHCQGPDLHAVVELPRVYILDPVLSEVIPDVSDMQTQLPDIQEPKLVAGDQVEAEDLREAVLSDAHSVLHLEAPAAGLALLREVVVHAFHCELKQGRVFLLGLVSCQVVVWGVKD